MEAFLNTYDGIVVTLVVIAQVLIVLVTVLLVIRRRIPKKLDAFLARYSFPTAAVVSLLAMVGSLGYSDVFLFQPCRLCWYQRILMYPQVLLLGLGSIRKEFNIRVYGMIMSAVGALIALYHYLMQFSVVPEGACSTVGYSVSCANYFTAHLGYITIPMMALTAFVFMFVLLAYSYVASHDTK